MDLASFPILYRGVNQPSLEPVRVSNTPWASDGTSPSGSRSGQRRLVAIRAFLGAQAAQLASERPGQTLQPTALVHEAYLRLFGSENPEPWNSRGHFFTAAAIAIRRVRIDQARRNSIGMEFVKVLR